MTKRTSVLIAGVVLVAAVLAVATGEAFYPRTNILTFTGAVALPGMVLPAGSYTFEVVDPAVGNNTVRVWSKDQRRLFFTGLTLTVERPRGMSATRVVLLGEGVRGEAPPIQVWYPLGSSTGREFIYR